MKTKKQIKKLKDKVYWLKENLKDIQEQNFDRVKRQRVRRDITRKILLAIIFLLSTTFVLSYLYEVFYK